jgi:hypothetical protein
MNKNKRLLIMMGCAALFIGMGYWWANLTPPPPPPPPPTENIIALSTRMEAISKMVFCEDSCKAIIVAIEDGDFDQVQRDNLRTQLNRAKLLSLILSYNAKKNEDCGDIGSRREIYSLLDKQFKIYPGNSGEVTKCLNNYRNISAFKNIQGEINNFKRLRYSENRADVLKKKIETTFNKLEGCLSDKKSDYLSQLSEFYRKDETFKDILSNPKEYLNSNHCAAYIGYAYYLNHFKCQ